MLASRERPYDYAASATIRKQAGRLGNPPTRHNPAVGITSCERALKRAVLHRKNALFYKTLNGAEVGDLFMSLIHTCELNGANSVRLPDRVAAARRGVDSQPRGVDALELPRDAGAAATPAAA